MNVWVDKFPKDEIVTGLTEKTVKFAEDFGSYLAKKDGDINALCTNQLRKFFGEVKRQQMSGYNQMDFILLKPKLAYAVGRTSDKKSKIEDFYDVMCVAIDQVKSEKDFRNFIKMFEAIVAYHKAAERYKVLK